MLVCFYYSCISYIHKSLISFDMITRLRRLYIKFWSLATWVYTFISASRLDFHVSLQWDFSSIHNVQSIVRTINISSLRPICGPLLASVFYHIFTFSSEVIVLFCDASITVTQGHDSTALNRSAAAGSNGTTRLVHASEYTCDGENSLALSLYIHVYAFLIPAD